MAPALRVPTWTRWEGFVYHSLGKIPQVGDVVVTDHLRIEVVSILGRRLRKLRINRIDANGAENEN